MDVHEAHKVIKLSQNENPYGPSPKAMEAVQRAQSEMSQYPEPHSQSLKVKLAKKLGLKPDNIFICAGLVESFDILIRNFVGDGENLVVPKVSFVAHRILADVFKKEIRLTSMKNFHIDVDEVVDKCDSKTRLIVLTNPNNPTGTMISGPDLLKVLDSVQASTVVVLDEAYFEYCCSDIYPDSLSLLKKYPNLIVMRTFSKIYGLAGLRVGYAIGAEDLISRFDYYQAPFTVNMLAVAAASAAIDDVEYVELSKKINQECRDELSESLKNVGCKVIPSESNFVFVSFDSQEQRDSVYDQFMQHHILVRKTDLFGDDKALRISIGTREMNRTIVDFIGSTLVPV
jgi:histidinol-phosphate aminotransferase